MKTRAFVREVVAAGGVFLRSDSDHDLYRLPNGEVMLIPVGGKHSDVKPYLVSKLRRLLARPAGGRSRTIPARDVPTEAMRYDLRALGLDVGEMDDAEVRREFERRFGPVLPRNPNHPHPDR